MEFKTKFKIGDTVKCIHDYMRDSTVGKIGLIIKIRTTITQCELDCDLMIKTEYEVRLNFPYNEIYVHWLYEDELEPVDDMRIRRKEK